MKNAAQPFFSVVMSCTSHEPFDADVERIVPHETGSWCNDYINTIHYSDKYLGKLVEDIKLTPWYENTLVIITGDHGQECSDRKEYNSAERHHVPFLLTGGVLKNEFRGKTYGHITSQVDFAATVLAQLQLPYEDYRWSKNVFNLASKEFAFYSFDDGFGWVSQLPLITYDNKMHQPFYQGSPSASTLSVKELKNGQAYLQVLMEEYVSFTGK
jgi:phosphoglycerol transferase MdoB-like AlkP superfamily enzyme